MSGHARDGRLLEQLARVFEAPAEPLGGLPHVQREVDLRRAAVYVERP